MRAGTLSWIVIPFLLASLAASGLEKPHNRRMRWDSRFHQEILTSGGLDPKSQNVWLMNEREHSELQPHHTYVDRPPTPAPKPSSPPRNSILKNGIHNPQVLRLEDNPTHDDQEESACLYDLLNETCSEAIYCVNIKPAEANDNPVQENCQNETIILSVKNRTKCLQTCLNETAVSLYQCGHSTYHFYPIDSPCNKKVESEEVDSWELPGTDKYAIAGALGIILILILLICIVFTVKKERKKTAEKCYDIRMQSNHQQEYMVENNLYSS